MAIALAPETVNLEDKREAGEEDMPTIDWEAGDSSDDEAIGVDEEDEEARVPRTKKAPVGMTAAEWQVHRLTHLPYNAACRCCVAGRKRDDPHRRRPEESSSSQADLDADGGASICAD